MRKIFLAVLCVTVLVGCWNKPFDLEKWNAAEWSAAATGDVFWKNNYERCSMGASLIKMLPGMSVADYNEMFYRHLVDFQNPEKENKALPSFEFLYVGGCMLGCHGGGIVLIRVDFEDGKIVKAVRIRS